MRIKGLVGAAMLAAIVPAAALADDPHDPAMRDAAARARDHEMIRQLNLQEQASVHDRDAGYAEGWRTWRAARTDAPAASSYATASREYDRDMAAYANDRAQYERRLAAWRRGVEACRNGDYSVCEN